MKLTCFLCVSFPGGGLGMLTDRDQWSWVFLNDRKEYFATDRKRKTYFPKSKTLKIPSSDIRSAKFKHSMIVMKNFAH